MDVSITLPKYIEQVNTDVHEFIHNLPNYSYLIKTYTDV